MDNREAIGRLKHCLDEIRESEMKCNELFNVGFDMGVIKDPVIDAYRRMALNYGGEMMQTFGAIRGIIESVNEDNKNESI